MPSSEFFDNLLNSFATPFAALDIVELDALIKLDSGLLAGISFQGRRVGCCTAATAPP